MDMINPTNLVCCILVLPSLLHIVAKCPGLAGTVPDFGPMSRLCPGLPDFAALSRNPARLHKWRCGTSINSVYYRISVRISRCLVGVTVHNRPKVGVVSPKWAWSVKFRARFTRIHYIFYSVPVSLLVNLATMTSSSFNLTVVYNNKYKNN